MIRGEIQEFIDSYRFQLNWRDIYGTYIRFI